MVGYRNVQYTILAEEANAFRSLVGRVPTGKSTQYPSGFVDFLRADSPPPPRRVPRPMSPPLFPRSETIGMGVKRSTAGVGAMPDSLASSMNMVGVEQTKVEEGWGLDEIAQENMRMLCGDMGEHILR
jgi:hypothetical protein